MSRIILSILLSFAICFALNQAVPQKNFDYCIYFRHYRIRKDQGLRRIEQVTSQDPELTKLADSCPSNYTGIPDNVNFGYVYSTGEALVKVWGDQENNLINFGEAACKAKNYCREYLNIVHPNNTAFDCLNNECLLGTLLMCSYIRN